MNATLQAPQPSSSLRSATSRDQLLAILCEAAEAEHCLMCSYLYAAFSLKDRSDGDLETEELAAVDRWRKTIIGIAREEMSHLAIVGNLLLAVGAVPHLRRPNFPVEPGVFPAEFVLDLAPLDAETLDHFIFLERPLGADDQDPPRYRKRDYERVPLPHRLMPFGAEYETVGELYEAIAVSLRELCRQYGEERVFLGADAPQLGARDFHFEGLAPVRNLADAERAIQVIIEQGEGAPHRREHSHFDRFTAIRSEWRTLEAARPAFVPYRPAARHPVMRSPVVASGRVQITAEPAALLLDAGNACYVAMLRLLARVGEIEGGAAPGRERVLAQAVSLMKMLGQIGRHLTTLPASEEHPGLRAGLTFTTSRAELLFQPGAMSVVMAERFDALAARLSCLAAEVPGLAGSVRQLAEFAGEWRTTTG